MITGSDSDEGYNQSSHSGGSSPSKSRPRSPRTPKYNLNLGELFYIILKQFQVHNRFQVLDNDRTMLNSSTRLKYDQ